MNIEKIEESVKHILETLPPGVTLVAAAKSRTPEEVEAVIRAGVTCVGHNYIQLESCDVSFYRVCSVCLPTRLT